MPPVDMGPFLWIVAGVIVFALLSALALWVIEKINPDDLDKKV